MARRGLLISIEGGEKTGKTTQAALLVEWLKAGGVDAVLTREPGGTAVGEAVRSILLDPGQTPLTPVSEALLFAASRGQLVAEVIRPALEVGRTVVADRYVDSSLAYQAFGLGLPLERVLDVNEWATGGLRPDLTVLLDGSDLVAFLSRSRSGEVDRIERRRMDFHLRVAEGYRELARRDPARFAVIDASRPPGKVAADIRRVVEPLLRGREVPGQ
ncbi:MAG: dTMP kinase [Bacillota bacterium]|jgi:dTMP kinase